MNGETNVNTHSEYWPFLNPSLSCLVFLPCVQNVWVMSHGVLSSSSSLIGFLDEICLEFCQDSER